MAEERKSVTDKEIKNMWTFQEKLLTYLDGKPISRLAEQIGESHARVSGWKHGAKPRAEALSNLANKTSTTVDYWINDSVPAKTREELEAEYGSPANGGAGEKQPPPYIARSSDSDKRVLIEGNVRREITKEEAGRVVADATRAEQSGGFQGSPLERGNHDRIVMDDGRAYEGKIVGLTATSVKIEIPGAEEHLSLKRESVAAIVFRNPNER